MLLASLLVAVSMNAAPYQGPDPARLMLLNADSCQFALSMKPLTTDAAELAKYDEDRKKAVADMEEVGPAAMKSGGDSVPLQTALKDFYTAADSYCKNPSNAGKGDVAAKEQALDKLLEAAGR